MAADVPKIEPTQIEAGTTLAFTRSFSAFPASAGWVLSYAVRGLPPNAAVADFSASSSGDDFSVSVPPSTTISWAPGKYTLAGYVANAAGTERYRVYSGDLTVTVYVAGTNESGYDGRTYWERVRDKLKEYFENGVIRDVFRYERNGVMTQVQTLKDVEDAIAYAESKIVQEQSMGKQKKIYAKFTNPL